MKNNNNSKWFKQNSLLYKEDRLIEIGPFKWHNHVWSSISVNKQWKKNAVKFLNLK